MATYRAADGAVLAFEDRGPQVGIPLLFIHGWQANGSVWTPLIDALGEAHRTIAVDLRGFGRSAGAPGPYTLQSFAGDLVDLIAEIDLDPVIVVAHSMGAAVAQRFAIDAPDAVEGLVLVAPVPAGGVSFAPKVEAFLRSTAGNPALAAQWLAGLATGERLDEHATLLADAAASASHEAAVQSFDSWVGADFASEAATIDTPTLVLAPELDRPMTPEFARENVAEVIEGSRFVVLEGAGHYAIVDDAEAIAALIDEFAESL